MGNATKVALVALLILLVVVVARFVREDSAPETSVTERPAGSSTLPGKVPAGAAARSASTPTNKAPDIASRGRQPATIPSAVSRNPAPAQPATGQDGSRSVASAAPSGSGSRVISSTPGTVSPTTLPPSPTTLPPSPATLPGSPLTQAGSSTTLPGSSGAAAGDLPSATVVQPSLPSPNPIGSLNGTGPSSVRRQGEPAGSDAGARPQEGTRSATQASVALVETQLPGSGDSRGASSSEPPSPFRPLAESGREVRGTFPPPAGASSGLREPRSPEPPAGSPAEPRPAAGYPKTHLVVKGDTFWGLADQYYEDGTLLHLIEKANPGVKLRPGMKITVPEPPAKPRPSVHLTSGSREPRSPEKTEKPRASGASRDYVVQKGDTLSLIARKFYGDAAKLHLLEEANPDLKYQMLQAGARIKIPAKAE